MKKILIFGRSGAGKSSLASRIGKKLGLPVFHLDTYFWLPGWVARSKLDLAIDIEKLLAENDSWVMDGNYKRSALESRIKAADAILILDFNAFTCTWRVIKRHLTYRNKTRPDMQRDCPKKLDFEFISYVWNYRKRTLSPTLNTLKGFPNKRILGFKNQKQVEAWIREIDSIK